MKVIAINGSPRVGGNTHHALRMAGEQLEAKGIEFEIIQVGNKNVHGCRDCGKCRENRDERCVITSDPLNEWIQKLKQADGIILASPVYYAGIRPLDSKGRARVMAYDVPVRCGDVLVHPQDFVFADHDGIVVIPHQLAGEVVTLAQRKISLESASRRDLLAGKSLREVFDTYGVL